MGLGIPLPDQVRRTRLVTVGDDLAVSVDAGVGSYFAALVQPPAETPGGTDVSPRSLVPSRLSFDASPQNLSAAARIQLQGTGETYELTSRVRTVRVAETIMGYEAEVMKLTELYPRVAALRESDDTSVESGLRCSIYSPDEQVAGRGEYENYQGEAPIEHEAALQVKNRKLALGAREFRIVSATANFEMPHVALDLRRMS